MKRTAGFIALITLFFLAVSLIIFPLINRHYDNENGMKIVVINRIIAEARTAVANGNAVMIDLDAYRREYEKRAVPDRVDYIDIKDMSASEEGLMMDPYASDMICPIKGTDNSLCGFLRIVYYTTDIRFTRTVTAAVLIISYIIIITFTIAGYRLMVKPFNTLSEYPEKIAKGRLDEGIPESKSRLFGRYIWGMNMLKDEMNLKDKNINAMEKEKQTLIISIAHGIKTPLSNIKLYAEAIERGIYHDDKKPDEKDAETAAKIKQNVDKVEVLVKEIMDSSAKVDVDHKAVITTFYLKELKDMVKKDYASRMELLHIPFDIVCENNPLLTSDKDGIYKVISQLLDNAVKYGSGAGISLRMGRQDEDVIISVRNKGNVLSEEECAYVFKSFWRGSNAKSKEGQGIGLYVARKIAESMGGDIFMKSWTSEDTTEVTLIIPIG
ncbi:MAG: HAMP domain-containing histidine kinase [Lachnospiraceae bacterium]|nr:HAMP domain-containing histidine kinase [Lachnospiraceae bacterium]